MNALSPRPRGSLTLKKSLICVWDPNTINSNLHQAHSHAALFLTRPSLRDGGEWGFLSTFSPHLRGRKTTFDNRVVLPTPGEGVSGPTPIIHWENLVRHLHSPPAGWWHHHSSMVCFGPRCARFKIQWRLIVLRSNNLVSGSAAFLQQRPHYNQMMSFSNLAYLKKLQF